MNVLIKNKKTCHKYIFMVCTSISVYLRKIGLTVENVLLYSALKSQHVFSLLKYLNRLEYIQVYWKVAIRLKFF